MRPIREIAAAARPEMRAILACCGQASDDALGGALAGDLDWRFLYGAAVRHGVLPLVFRRLRRLPPGVAPPGTVRSMARDFVLNAARADAYAATLGDLLARLESRGVPAVPYKGPVLAQRAHGDHSLRWIGGDLDIVVRRRDAAAAAAALVEAGYRPSDLLPGRKLNPGQAYHLEMHAADGRPMVELHWRLAEDLHLSDALNQWWRNPAHVDVAGRSLPAWPVEHVLVALCLHGGKDLWNRLLLPADVAGLLRRCPNIDAGRVLALADTPDSRLLLNLGLLLADELMDAPLPPGLAGQAHTDSRAERLARPIAARLMDGASVRVRFPDRFGFAWSVRHRPREKARYVAHYLRVLATPDRDDLAWVDLPRPLHGGHYVLRPIRRLSAWARELFAS